MKEMKRSEMLELISKNIETTGSNHNAFRHIVLRAADTAQNYIRQFSLASPEKESAMLTTALKEFIELCRAPERNRNERDEKTAYR